MRKWINEGDGLIKFQEKRNEMRYQQAVKAYDNARTLMFTIGGIAILLAMGVAFFIATSITKPLGEGVGVMNSLSKGDLTVDIEAKSKDETGQLLASMKAMVDNLKISSPMLQAHQPV